MANESSDHHFGLAVNVAVEALKALLLINGGAAAALVALTGKDHGSPDYSQAILTFGIGAGSAVVAFISAYFSQLAYANHRFPQKHNAEEESKRHYRHHFIWQRVAIVMVILSLIAGSIGMWQAWNAADRIAHPIPSNVPPSQNQFK